MSSKAVIHHGDNFHFAPHWDVAERTQRFHQAQGQPWAELVQWLVAVGDGLVLNKDGSLMACLALKGLDMDSAPNHAVNTARGQVLYALEQMQDARITVSWQVRRRKTTVYPAGDFPDSVSSGIQAALKADFLRNTQYMNKVHVVITMPPPANAMRVMAQVRRSQEELGGWRGTVAAVVNGLKNIAKGESEFPYRDFSEIQEQCDGFAKVLEHFQGACASIGVRRLRGDELGQFLELSSSPTSDSERLEGLPESDTVFLDTTMPKTAIDNSYGDYLCFQWDEREVWGKTYSLNLEKRKDLSVDMLDRLMSAQFEFTLAQTFKLLPRAKGTKVIEDVERYHANRRFPFKSYIVAAITGKSDMEDAPVNKARQEAADEAETLKNLVSMNKAGIGHYYGTVMVLADTPEQCHSDSLRCEEILLAARIAPRHERLHKLSSFLSTVPGCSGEVVLWNEITTENFADLCPLRGLSSGELVNEFLSEQLGVKCPALIALPTAHRAPLYFTGYVGDLGHGMLVGPSGTGKTTFVNLLWTMFRKYPGARFIGFDKNFSVRPPVILQGGSYVDLSPENTSGSARMNPLSLLAGMGGARHIGWVVDWIELLARSRGYAPTSQDRTTLERIVGAIHSVGLSDPSQLRLGSVVVQIPGLNTNALAQALMPWTEGRLYGRYFDNVVDELHVDGVVGIENGSMLTSPELSVPYMAYAFYRIETLLRDTRDKTGLVAPTFIYVPEVWYFLENVHFRAKFFEFLVTLRKLLGVVWLDTQSPDQLVQSSIYSAMRDNMANLVLTPNKKALTGTLSKLYRDEFLLTDEELQAVANGVPKQDYFLKQADMSRRLTLNLPREAMACLRSDKRAQTLLDRLLHADPLDPDWRNAYIEELCRET